MKARKLLPIALLAAMTLVACGGGGSGGSEASSQTSETSETSQASEQSQSESSGQASQSESSPESSSQAVQYGASVKNKEDFAELRVGDHVDLDIELTPEANVAMEIAQGNLIIEADKAGIVTITGAGVSAVGAGEVTVSVYYMDFETAADQLTFTVEEKLTPKVKYGTVHEGTLEDPFDNADAWKVGLWAKDNGTTPETDLYIKGKVQRFYNAPGSYSDGRVSFYLEKGEEDAGQFEVFKLYKDDGKGGTVALTDDDIWVGAEVTAHGPITYYATGNQPETSYAWLDKVEGDKPQPPVEYDATVTEAIAVGNALADSESTYDYYNVTGYVVRKSGTNYFMADTKTVDDSVTDKQLLELYNISSADEQAKLLKGAKVTVKMRIKNYHGQIENGNTPVITVVTEGEPWTINYIDVTVAGALEAAKALADGATSKEYYKVTGQVVEITTPYSEQYGNISFTMADTADGETLTVFRAKVAAADAEKIVAGVVVEVAGNLQNYVKNEVHTYELVSGSVTKIGGEEEQATTVAEALEIAKALADGATTEEEYDVKGLLIAVTTPYSEQYGNISFTIADSAEGEALTVFRAKVDAAEAPNLVAGVIVTIHGKLQNYVKNETHTYELVSGTVTAIEEPVKYTSVAEGLEIAKALADGATTEEEYDIEGLLIAVTTPYSEQYGNISFTIADSAEGETLTVFRAKVDAEEAPKLVAGVKVLVHGKLQNYVKNEAHTYEVVSGTVMNIEEQGGGGSQGEPNYGTLENPQTVAGLLADDGTICPQSNGSFSAQKVIVKGVLKEATYGASYGTYSGVLQDLEDATKTIKFTGVKLSAELAEQVAQNDVVILEHYLEYYNNGYSLYYQKDGSGNYDYGDFLAVVEVGVSAITLDVSEHATVNGLAETYTNYETAEFTVAADDGYEIDSVKVNGTALEANEGKYSFLVAGNATVKVIAREAGGQQEETVSTTFDVAHDNFTFDDAADTGHFENEKFSLDYDGNGGNTKQSSYTATDHLRVYANSIFSISADTDEVSRIVSITFTTTGSKHFDTAQTFTGGEFEDYTAKGATAKVACDYGVTVLSFTAKAQVRIASITIEYVAK